MYMAVEICVHTKDGWILWELSLCLICFLSLLDVVVVGLTFSGFRGKDFCFSYWWPQKKGISPLKSSSYVRFDERILLSLELTHRERIFRIAFESSFHPQFITHLNVSILSASALMLMHLHILTRQMLLPVAHTVNQHTFCGKKKWSDVLERSFLNSSRRHT